jgi:ParB family transcriptional regulator, chromosome partitioning protein
MTIQMIPLNQLVPSPSNVRKTGAKNGVEALAANIAALGLLQNLQVRPTEAEKFEVVAGSRRLAALKILAKQKAVAKDEPIACKVLDAEDAIEVSLAENEMREAMHPADQFAAFKQLKDAGQGAEDIAARFGVTPLVVKQRLKLACVSPKLMKLYKEDALNLEQLMAFTVSDDHAAQESTWDELAEWNRSAQSIRRHLTKAHVDADDRRVRFVTLDAYKDAGGAVITDLFETHSYVADTALLDKLCAEKLEAEAAAVRGEGWKWVEIMPDASYEALQCYGRVPGKPQPLPAKQQKALDKMSAELEAFSEQDELTDADADRADRLEAQIAALQEAALTWGDRQKARCGAVVGIGYDGALEVTRGLITAADRKASKNGDGDNAGENGEGAGTDAGDKTPGLSAKLVEELTAHRTQALRAVLADQTMTALAAVVHGLALPVFYLASGESVVDIRADSAALQGEGIDTSAAARQLAERHQAWVARLPEQPEGLWDWLTRQDMQTQINLLAYCVAVTVKPQRGGPFDTLAAAVGLDMAQWWRPTAEGYLGRVSKTLILEAVTEGVGSEAAASIKDMKKGDMAERAEGLLDGAGWLPALMRR